MFPKFEDTTKTYNDFKKIVLSYYPDASEEFRYSLHDMDYLVGEWYCLGILNINDLSYFHLQFIAITMWLIKKNQLRDLEQQHAYVCAFQPYLLNTIMQQL